MPRKDLLLRVEGLEKRFGGIVAVSDYTLSLGENELMGLIGPNGAGKTTVFNMLSGILKPSRGRIFLNGEEITSFSPSQTAKAGIARTFQNIRLFKDLSVLDNIKVAFHMHQGRNLFHTLCHTKKFCRTEEKIDREARGFGQMMGLGDLLDEPAKNLPYGDQRRMEIARALAARPKVLLLDEPAAGMNHQETADLMEIIRKIHSDYSMSILVVEHDMHMVMNLCRRIQVLNQGRLLAQGTPGEIQESPEVIKAYLGAPKEKTDAEC
ncbi:ABC transporter ATP-binding protein [Desulfospira joergensenii]|uniref:ABC transporter ATP-binding protein n=1 Tax=Desulfospira joergensenii TaxID=53329 RepID=UPI0003B3A1CF|nr:ABC transporter ATP-binding protein [Desulfospira joergensenii]